MARTTAISIFRGEDITLNFTAYTTDTGTTAEDITGLTIYFTVARKKDSKDKLISKACSLVVAASGTYKAVIDDTDTDDLETGVYYWDTWRTNDGYERLLGSGSFTITGNARIPA